MDGDYTQLGIAGFSLGIIFFIIRYFVEAQKEERQVNRGLTERVTRVVERNARTHEELKRAILANTDATKQSTDYLSKMILELMKSKEINIRK